MFSIDKMSENTGISNVTGSSHGTVCEPGYIQLLCNVANHLNINYNRVTRDHINDYLDTGSDSASNDSAAGTQIAETPIPRIPNKGYKLHLAKTNFKRYRLNVRESRIEKILNCVYIRYCRNHCLISNEIVSSFSKDLDIPEPMSRILFHIVAGHNIN